MQIVLAPLARVLLSRSERGGGWGRRGSEATQKQCTNARATTTMHTAQTQRATTMHDAILIVDISFIVHGTMIAVILA